MPGSYTSAPSLATAMDASHARNPRNTTVIDHRFFAPQALLIRPFAIALVAERPALSRGALARSGADGSSALTALRLFLEVSEE